MKNRIALVLAPATLVSLVALWLAFPTPKKTAESATEVEPNRASAELERVERQMADLRRSQTWLSRQLANQTNAAAETERMRTHESSVNSKEPKPPAEPIEPEDAEARSRALLRQRVGQLDTALASEREDVEWGRQTTQQLGAVVRALPFSGVTLKQAKCGSTLCKLTLATGEEDDPSIGHAVLSRWQGSGLFYFDRDEEEAVAYLGRPGHALSEHIQEAVN